MQTMYEGKVNSPATTLDGVIDDSVTTINIIDGAVLPLAPNLAVIGTGEDAETILYANRVGNVLSNITRGFQGIAKGWSTGEAIARLFTEYDYNALKGNIGTIAGRKITDFGECNSEELRGKITDETGTGKAVFGTYPEITKINLTEGQIKFPAAVNPSADPNIQDDYEEGEWTPALEFGGASVGMAFVVQEGFYTKVGRQVTCTGRIILSAKGTSSGSATINGVPFPSRNDNGAYSAGSMRLNNITFADVYNNFISKGYSHLNLQENTKVGGVTPLTNGNFMDTSDIIFFITYVVA